MDAIAYGRAFIGTSLAFHIAIALFGVGVPLLISLAELIGITKKDRDFSKMARRWTFAMTTLFAAGAISGTVVAVAFMVLLAPFMAIAGKTIILPFFLETFAFFIEAAFLGIYVFSWDRLKPWIHWLTSLPIVIASAASAFLITTMSAFMSAPQGFTMAGGLVTSADQWTAMWNAAVPTRTGHSILSYYATTAFVFAAMAALALLREKTRERGTASYHKRMLSFTLLLGLLFSLGVVATGDQAARFIARYEPQKFAAAEGILETQSHAPLALGGWFDDQRVLHGALVIPDALSLLIGGAANTVVAGLKAFDPATWPPAIIHYFFDLMALIGGLLLATPILYFAATRWRPRLAHERPMLWLVIATGIASLLAVELGWMLTEIGRQPWTIRGVLLTSNAFTPSPSTALYALAFPVFYVALAGVTLWVLIAHYRHHHDD